MGRGYLIIAIVAAIVAICIIVPRMCPITMGNLFPKTEISVESLRFQKIDTFVFEKSYGGTTTAVIYKDTKTGIQYLYIRQGVSSGGPCITRLWEKPNGYKN